MSIREYAIPVLRGGTVLLFLWFGLSQILDPQAWVSWVPEWPTALTGLSPETIVFLNGAFETAFGALLLLGLWTRWVALLLALHLFIVAYEIGYNDIGIRDFSLAVATLALAMWGDDRFSVRNFFKKKDNFQMP